MGSSVGNRPKGRRFPSENNFAPKQKGINTALRYEQCVNFLKVLMRASPFCFFCVKTKERRKNHPKGRRFPSKNKFALLSGIYELHYLFSLVSELALWVQFSVT